MSGRLLHRILPTTALCVLSITAACGREPSAPLDVPAANADQIAGEYASVQEQIEALSGLLARNGGLDQLLSRGTDPALVAERRQRVESQLPVLRARLSELEGAKAGRRFTPASVGEVGEAPPCLLNLNADGCFLDWYSTISHTGSGSVYQWTSTVFHHNTTTYIQDNGTALNPPKSTYSFGLSPTWSKNFSFAAADPNCLSGSHNITEQTSHHISLGITEVGLAEGEQDSADHSQCVYRYLTVSVSPGSIGVGATAGITVGHVPPSGCESISVTSSNSDVAEILDGGSGTWAAQGLSGGTVTIRARCGDGTSGSTTLTVTGPPPDECTQSSGGTTVAYTCGPKTSTPGGTADEPPPGPSGGEYCRWERDFVIYMDGSWDWLGEWEHVCYEEMAIVPGTSVGNERLKVRLVAGKLGNGRAAVITGSKDRRAGVTIEVDTSRATGADLDQAFAIAQRLPSRIASDKSGTRHGVVMSSAAGSTRGKNPKQGQGDKYLDQLRKVGVSGISGKTRAIVVTVDVQSPRLTKTQ